MRIISSNAGLCTISRLERTAPANFAWKSRVELFFGENPAVRSANPRIFFLPYGKKVQNCLQRSFSVSVLSSLIASIKTRHSPC